MAKQISKITVSAMANGAHYNFMKSVLDRAKAAEIVVSKLSSDVTALEKAFEVEDENLLLSQKSRFTARISEADTQRDAFYFGYRNAMASFLTLSSGEMKESAENLQEHLNTYKVDPREQLDRQTGLMINFIKDLEGKLKDDVACLGLTQMVTKMKEANDTVYTLLIERDNEKSVKIAGAVKASRLATDDAYQALVLKVNALAVVEGDAAYASFIDGLNSQIVRFKREALGQKVSTAKATDTDTTEATDTTDTSSDTSGSDTTDTSDTGSDVVVGEDSDGHPTVE